MAVKKEPAKKETKAVKTPAKTAAKVPQKVATKSKPEKDTKPKSSAKSDFGENRGCISRAKNIEYFLHWS